MTLPLLAGLAFGLLLGAVAGYFFAQRTQKDAESTAEALSAKIVTKQAEQILRLAESKLTSKKEVIDGTLQAMKTDLNRVEHLMHQIGTGNTKVDTKLTEAARVIQNLTDTTGNLSKALASNSGRGQWGERMAEDVLRLSGLIEGINYIKQKKLDGAGSKPDFTFMLPQQLKLNMDVKFPFNNYQLYAEAKTEKDRDECKKKFLKDVRLRVKEVQTRDYINPEDKTVDYVLLFVPNEQIFGFINEVDRSLIDEALQAKTILCSPLSLYAILAVIRQSIDNFSIEGKSREMLSLFSGFRQQWEKFKEQMETVQKRFESVHTGYEELTGTRERQLDKHFAKIEELRSGQSDVPAIASAVFEQAATKNVKKVSATPTLL